MKSRLGRHLENFRDKVQMLGMIEGGVEVCADGSRHLKERISDTVEGNVYMNKRDKKPMNFDNENLSSSDEDIMASSEIVRCRRFHSKTNKKTFCSQS